MGDVKYPVCILLFSGKRKSGKDFFTEKLLELFNSEQVAAIKISMPIKMHFSDKYKLSLKELMSSGEYKENYRSEMITWSDEMRKKDPGIFCRSAIDMLRAKEKPIWIVSDVRRRTDVAWFRENYGDVTKTIRIEAGEKVRLERGWVYTSGVDDVASECDLDGYTDWDWIIDNNGDDTNLHKSLTHIHQYVKSCY